MPTAIVTGGSAGLGRALIETLSELGWDVVTDARRADPLDEAIGALRSALPGRVVGLAGDITDAQHRSKLVDAARQLGDLRLVVNNASSVGSSPMPTLSAYPLELWRYVQEVNVVAPLALIQECLPLLGRHGRILNVSSDAAVEAYAGWGGYAASKAALDQLTRVLAVEHPDLGVYSVDPGDMRTQLHQDAFPGEDISDRPSPDASLPGILALILGDFPSGRYVSALVAQPVER